MNSNIPTKIILLVITSGLFFPLAISAQTSNPHAWTGDDPVVIPTTNPHSLWDEDDTPSGGGNTGGSAGGSSGSNSSGGSGSTGASAGGSSGGSSGANIPDSGQVSFLTTLPFIGEPDNFSDLINALFIMTLVLGALLAVVKLTIAGATYMLDGSVTKKQDALASIKGAILGLLLILSTTLILTQINPDITDMDALQNTLTITVPDEEDDEDEDVIDSLCDTDEGCTILGCGERGALHLSCSLWCESWIGGYFNETAGGFLTENQCIVSHNEINQDELINSVLCSNEGFAPETCEVRDCGERGLFDISCENWCEDEGGIYHVSDGGFFTTNKCIISE